MKFNTDRLRSYLVTQMVALTVVVVVVCFYFLFGLQVKVWLDPICWATVFLIFWTVVSWVRLTGQFFDLYSIFILATVAFNCGQIFLQVLHLNPDGMLAGKFTEKTLFETVLYIDVALAALHLGALWRLRGLRELVPAGRGSPAAPELFQVGTFLVIVSVLPTLYVLRDLIAVVRTSGYFGLYERSDLVGADNIPTLIAGLFVPGLLLLIAGAREKVEIRLFAEGGLVLYALIFILLGRRGDGAEALISYAIVRHYCVRPIPSKVLLPVSLFTVSVVFPIMALVRNVDLNSRADLNLMVQAFDSLDNPIAAALGEMGGSMQAVSYTMELVPKYRPYDQGASYFYSIFSIVPNFFWRLHPSIARGSPSIWLVNTVDPGIALLGGGIGYSFIAESYLNFGWWAGPLFLVAIGYAISALVRWGQFRGDPTKIAVAASFFGSLLTFARADSQSIVRPLIWYSLLPYLAILILQKIHRLQLAPKRAP